MMRMMMACAGMLLAITAGAETVYVSKANFGNCRTLLQPVSDRVPPGVF